MFEYLKKVFGWSASSSDDHPSASAVSEWAGTQGFSYWDPGSGRGFTLTGEVSGRPWKLELGAPSRDYIIGEELRARAELGVNEDAAVLIINRPLKDSLEKRAYEQYTDTLQTRVDSKFSEEMGWLSMYPEIGWDELPSEFWTRYAVLADRRSHAVAWIDQNLAELLMSWPKPGPDEQVPFMLMLLRGKVYLRMQYSPACIATLQHAAISYTTACQSAVARLSTDIVL